MCGGVQYTTTRPPLTYLMYPRPLATWYLAPGSKHSRSGRFIGGMIPPISTLHRDTHILHSVVDSAVVRGARRLVQRALWARAPHAPPAPVVLGGRDAPVKRAPAPRVHRVAELHECHLIERPGHQEVHVELCTARRMSCRLVLVLTVTVARHTSSTRRFDTSPYREYLPTWASVRSRAGARESSPRARSRRPLPRETHRSRRFATGTAEPVKARGSEPFKHLDLVLWLITVLVSIEH